MNYMQNSNGGFEVLDFVELQYIKSQMKHIKTVTDEMVTAMKHHLKIYQQRQQIEEVNFALKMLESADAVLGLMGALTLPECFQTAPPG
jgi:hypothetical protein